MILISAGAVARPFAVHAQARDVPVVGFLNGGTEAAFGALAEEFRRGLQSEGYVEGRNLTIEYRWANGQGYARLEELADDLVRRRVSLIVGTGGTRSARAAMAVTTTIPILFISGADAVRAGLVASLNHPGGNATGVSLVTSELAPKRLDLLHELAPRASTVTMLVNSVLYPVEAEQNFMDEIELKQTSDAAVASGLKPLIHDVARGDNLETALELSVKSGADALFVSADPFFTARRAQIVALAARYRLPAIYPWRQFAEVGGLMSYGPSIREVYRQLGRYSSRILKGAKPGDLPVQLPTKFELVINSKTARALGLAVSPWLIARADEVLE